jgi:hypothetical protein
MHLLTNVLHLEAAIRSGRWIVLLIACLVGLIPESGPHLIFVTLFAQGVVPFSVLLASSVVQDGHGMLPMLAHSRREFLQIMQSPSWPACPLGLPPWFSGTRWLLHLYANSCRTEGSGGCMKRASLLIPAALVQAPRTKPATLSSPLSPTPCTYGGGATKGGPQDD